MRPNPQDGIAMALGRSSIRRTGSKIGSVASSRGSETSAARDDVEAHKRRPDVAAPRIIPIHKLWVDAAGPAKVALMITTVIHAHMMRAAVEPATMG
jgi:hypothetical protein